MKIVVVGSSNTDMIVKTSKIPKPGETIIGGTFSTAAGGKGANQAVAAARAGGNVTFIARVGKDIFGQQAIERFKTDNINVNNIKTDEKESSGVALIIVDKNGENIIAVSSGANAKLSLHDIEEARAVIQSADILLMQLETPLETILKATEIAFQAGVKVVLNPAPACILPHDLLKMISIITPNENETELLTGISVTDVSSAGEAADVLIKKGLETVIITLGARGAFYKTKNNFAYVPGFKIDPVDATAAGDVFNGTLCVALAEGKILDSAVKIANAAAALSVTKLGAQPSAPKRHEIEKFIASADLVDK